MLFKSYAVVINLASLLANTGGVQKYNISNSNILDLNKTNDRDIVGTDVGLVEKRASSSSDFGSISNIFWSYYDSKSVNRASTSQGSYDRISPVVWTGGPQDNSLVDKNRLILGEFLKLSHGPRRKRRDLVVDTEPASHTEYARYSLPEIIKEDPLISWPRKTVSSDAPPPTFYSTQPSPLPEYNPGLYRNIERPYPQAKCSHSCRPGGPPCCQPEYPVLASGPFVQPGLFENWVTSIFQFGGQHPYLYTALKTMVYAFGIFVLISLWAVVGQSFNLLDLPKARFIAPIPENLVHFDLDVTGGDWLTRLEEHVSQADLPEDVYRFLCCLRPSKDEKDEEKKMLECEEVLARSSTKMKCPTSTLYDITFNMDNLKDKINRRKRVSS